MDSAADSDDLRVVTRALRAIAGDGQRVTLAQLARESDLTPARAEGAMCNIERVAPVSAQRVVEPGADVAWRVSL